MARDENYAPKSTHECLLNWLFWSTNTTITSTETTAELQLQSSGSYLLSSSVNATATASTSEAVGEKGSDEVSNVDSANYHPSPPPPLDTSTASPSRPLPLPSPSSISSQFSLHLIAGENILKKYKHIRWCLGAKPKPGLTYSGRMLLTDYRIVLQLSEDCQCSDYYSRYRIPPYFNRLDIPLHSLYRASVDTATSTLLLNVKDSRSISIQASSRVKRTFIEETTQLINRYAFPGSMRQLKLFTFRGLTTAAVKGWEMSDLMTDYKRMGVVDASEWRVYDNGSDYKLCDSYPPYLIVPAKLKSTALYAVAEHRSRGRLPVVTYRYSNGAVLLRSAQPLVGITKKSSVEDGYIVECFRMRDKVLDNR
jgi:Myotubularin-like phosphatase domain